MENKNLKESELLKRLQEVIKELHKLTDEDSDKSFIIMGRDAKFNDSMHLIATAGTRGELAKNVFGLLMLSKDQEFVSDGLDIFNHITKNSVRAELKREIRFTPNDKNLN